MRATSGVSRYPDLRTEIQLSTLMRDPKTANIQQGIMQNGFETSMASNDNLIENKNHITSRFNFQIKISACCRGVFYCKKCGKQSKVKSNL